MTVQIQAEEIAQARALADVQRQIHVLATRPDAEILADLRRWLHNLKGEACLLGFDDLAAACHAAEDVLLTAPPPSCVERLLVVTDWLQAHCDRDRLAAADPLPGRVSLRPLCRQLAGLVHDLAGRTGRQVTFVTMGEDLALDGAVLALLRDPLVHLVRNAVDHGLEPTRAERLAAGKPATGCIELHAAWVGDRLRIEVQDDGRGLSRDTILTAARARGLVAEDCALTDREVHDLVYAPGFSTALVVTEISGRGVGMDVVRRNVAALGGTCEIRSEPGRGCTFCLELPTHRGG